ncbi:hypothetical protein [Hyphococcus sp.]|uniref:hypothetical protein n=1 Tax=Hyphococcus sp. TaxID=2038636 RepID=UPI0020871E93|nr:MAG: hypothetical protein DHS20C04_31880 [Marinicaulis sp.]
MTASDSSQQDAEQLARSESERHTLLYADKQLLAKQEYRELLRGFRARATGTMSLMGFLLVMQVTFAALHFAAQAAAGGDPWENWVGSWGRLLMSTIFAAMFINALRDRRRCSEVLGQMKASGNAQ